MEYRYTKALLFLAILVFLASFILMAVNIIYALIAIIIGMGFCLFFLAVLNSKMMTELDSFVHSINNRDYSIRFNQNHPSKRLKTLYHKFEEIRSMFTTVNIERERHSQLIAKILEIIQTGLISFRIDNGEIVWINEVFIEIMNIPYLKNIQGLKSRYPELYDEIINLGATKNKLFTIKGEKQLKLLISVNTFFINGLEHKLICFQNINVAIDVTEANAWRRLLDVMTHEIMNSIAPISSLTDTLSQMLENFIFDKTLASENLEDIKLGIDTIKNRSNGLLQFTEEYRKFNNVPLPKPEKVSVKNLFAGIENLMLPTLVKENIKLKIDLPLIDILVYADRGLLEQVLVNLLLNAKESFSDTKHDRTIVLYASQKNDLETIIKIKDNGNGMTKELIEKIFIPFFTNRKNGKGIGLSICKQIMLLHKGNIEVISRKGYGTEFILNFP